MIALRTDNDWRYKERSTGSLFQWNDRNFNANYGGDGPATHVNTPANTPNARAMAMIGDNQDAWIYLK